MEPQNSVPPTETVTQNNVPGWIPDELQARIREYQPQAWPGIVDDLSRSFKRYGLDSLVNTFNIPDWDKRRGGLSKTERVQILKGIGITEDDLHDYAKAGQESPEQFDAVGNRIMTKVWNVTSEAWEKERPKRENEIERWDRIVASGNRNAAIALGRIDDKAASLAESLLGKSRVNSELRHFYAIPSGVETTFRSRDLFLKEK